MLGRILLYSATKTFGHIGGLRSKLGLRLIRNAVANVHEIGLETVAFATQIKTEEIMRAIDKNKAYEYVVKADRKLPENEQTVFLCKYLDSLTAANLGDQIYVVKGVGAQRREQLLTGSQQLKILETCLVGWKNFKDDDGNPVQFDTHRIRDMIDCIPPVYRGEIADFIRGESEVNEGETKS